MAIARGEITITELYDGDNFYRAWADTPDGSGDSFTTEESDRAYLGVYSGREEPTDYSQYKWSRIRGESAITAILSNDSHQIGTDENGNYGNYTGAKTTVAVFQGGEDDTSNWKVDQIEIEPAGAVTGEVIDAYTYKVVDLKTDEASVIFRLTHKKGEYSPLEKTFTLSKNKQGISGQHATSYFLSFNDTAVKKFRETGTMEPAQLMMQGMSIKADQKPVPQSGYFKIYEQSEIALDRDQYEQAYVDKKLDEEELYVISEKNYPLILTYTSKEPEERLTYEYTDLIDIMSIKVYWYRDADFEELVDVQTISITSDGEKGDPGENAPLIKLSGDTQVIKISEDGVKTPNSNFTITGKSLNADIEKWEYAVNGGSFSTNLPAGITRNNNVVIINPEVINFNTLSIQATGAGVSDTFTVAQMADGLNAYTVLLSNESHTFQADTQKAVASSATTDILAYRGTKRMPVSVESVTGLPTKGMTHTVSNNGKDNASVTFNVTTSLTSPSGLVSINLKIDGQQITKEFSYALSFKGDTGEAGKDAISAVLTNESITFAADKDGIVQNYVGNTGNFLLMEGTTNRSAGTKFSLVSQTDVSATINENNGSYTIFSMTNGTSVTTGQATFRATYKGTVIDKTVTISKSIAGQTGGKGDPGVPGGKGDPGAPATSYWLTSSVDTITVKYNGDYDPKTITYYGHSKTGSNNTQSYAGQFIIQTSIDGINFTQAYRSSTNTNKVDFSVPEDVLFIKAKFYQSGGTTYLLDEQTTPILHSADGLKGVGLEDKDYQVGTEIYTDKADDSVVHVEIDGKSYQHTQEGNSNLLINSNFSRDIITYQKRMNVISRRHNQLTFSNQVNANTGPGFEFKHTLSPDKKYTLSFDLESSGDTSYNYIFLRQGTSQEDLSMGESLGAKVPNKRITKGDNRVEITFDGIENASGIWLGISASLELILTMKNLKLEEGSVATPQNKPTPDYPSEIERLNDFDVVSQKSEGGVIDGIEIGGRNYVTKNSYHSGKTLYGGGVGGTGSFSDSNNDRISYLIIVEPDTDYKLTIHGDGYYHRLGEFSLSSDEFIVDYNRYNSDLKTMSLKTSLSTERLIISIHNNGKGFPIPFEDVLFKLEKGNKGTDWTPAPEDITENTNHPLIDKINLSLSEPLRSVGDVKDRLFKDSDGLWKVERNIGEITLDGTEPWAAERGYWYMGWSSRYGATKNSFNVKSSHFVWLDRGSSDGVTTGITYGGKNLSQKTHNGNLIFYHPKHSNVTEFKEFLKSEHSNGTPVITQHELESPEMEILDQEFQDELNNLRSFQDSNYVYTIINNKTDILSSKLSPTIRCTFKGGGWYARWKSAHDLEKTTDYIEQEIKRTQNTAWIRAGMRIGYSSFTQTNPNSVYVCGLEYRDGYRDMVLVDKPAEIYIRESNETALIPNQSLSASGIPAGVTAYIIWDNTEKSLFLAYLESKMTQTGVDKKRWRNNTSGETITFTDSLFAIGEIEV